MGKSAYAAGGQMIRQWKLAIPGGPNKTNIDVSNINQKNFILIMKNQSQLLQFKIQKPF